MNGRERESTQENRKGDVVHLHSLKTNMKKILLFFSTKYLIDLDTWQNDRRFPINLIGCLSCRKYSIQKKKVFI